MSRRKRTGRSRPPQERNQQPNKAVAHEIHQQVELFRGPLPPPDVLKAYNEATDDAADRILRMTEAQGEHRRKAEAAIITKGLAGTERGQWFGFIIAMTALIGGILLLLFDKNIQGYATIGAGFAALVSAFVVGRVSQAREQRESAEDD